MFAQVILESGRTMLSLAQLMQIAVLLWTLSLQHLKTFQSFVLVLKDREVQFLWFSYQDRTDTHIAYGAQIFLFILLY